MNKYQHYILEAAFGNVDSPAFKSWFANSKVTKNGEPQIVYHGSKRSDRIAASKHFDKRRATSGPMAFFTDDPKVASNYSTNKSDTSLNTPESYAEWYFIKVPGARKPVQVDNAWFFLTQEQRAKIASLAPRIHEDDDNNIILDDESHTSGVGGYDYEIKTQKGNHLKALVAQWLDGGVLYGREEEFEEVLALAGLDRKLIEYRNPYAEYSGVVPVYLSIQNPLDTRKIPDKVYEAIKQAAKRKRGPKLAYSSDLWGKRNLTPDVFLERLMSDAKDNTTHAWTSIPDWATKALESLGYDGIKDVGGKFVDYGHTVWIPFHENQIKSIFNKGTWNPNKKDILASDEDHAKALRETGFWGAQGAGCIILAKSTNRFLLPHRSRAVEQPGTWGVWGGAIDKDENPRQAAIREVKEEAGYDGKILSVVTLYVFEKGTFRYSNFLVVIEEEFKPDLNWETQGFKWVEFGDWPEPMHFGLKALLDDNASERKIKEAMK